MNMNIYPCLRKKAMLSLSLSLSFFLSFFLSSCTRIVTHISLTVFFLSPFYSYLLCTDQQQSLDQMSQGLQSHCHASPHHHGYGLRSLHWSRPENKWIERRHERKENRSKYLLKKNAYYYINKCIGIYKSIEIDYVKIYIYIYIPCWFL